MMLNAFKSFMSIAIAFGFLTGCGNKTGRDVQQAVDDNKSAQTKKEWEESPYNPEQLFEKWHHEFKTSKSEQQKIKSDICQALLALDSESLSVFENEIDNKENTKLLTDCASDLKSKLDTYYKAQREHLDVPVDVLRPSARSRNNFQFPKNVQTRDFSNGYVAKRGNVANKEVILTFDDGPNEIYTASILQSLKEVNAKAIFFQLGKNARLMPEMVKKVVIGGHGIGSHSMSHTCLGNGSVCSRYNGRTLTTDEAVNEITSGHQAIHDVTGIVDPFFRFPYGESSPELSQYLKENSVGEFLWTVDSEDWRAQPNTALLEKTLQQLVANGNRGIILFHDIQRRTAEIMPQFLRELYSRGYSVVLIQASDPRARYNSKLVKRKLP